MANEHLPTNKRRAGARLGIEPLGQGPLAALTLAAKLPRNPERPMSDHDPLAELIAKAHALAPEERARLATSLLASLEDPQVSDVQAVWDVELLRRLTEIEQGTVALTPIEAGFAQARRLLAP